MKNRYILTQQINPNYLQNLNNEVFNYLQNQGFQNMNIKGESVFVKNATVTIIMAGAIKLNFDGSNYIVESWLYGMNALGTKRDYDKEVGLTGFYGKLFKVEQQNIAKNIIKIARKYNC